MDKIKEVALLIPAYNPDEKMLDLLLECVNYFENIVVVNDGCSKEYDEVFAKVPKEIKVLTHEVNKGKGRALKTGIGHVKEAFPDVLGVVTADADGQHTIEDIVNCCNAFLENPKEAIFGCRDFYGDANIPARSVFGNRVTSRLMKFFCDIALSDTQTGLRVLPMSAADLLLSIKGERYEYEMNCIFEMKNADITWREVPIEVIYLDDNASSHFNPFLDSIRIYKVFLKFCLSSVGSAIVDVGLFALFGFLFRKVGFALMPIPTISNILARICSGIFNYSVNKIIFKHRGKVAESGPKYLILFLISMTVATALVTLFTKLSGGQFELLIKILVDCLIFFFNYKIEQVWVFKNKKVEQK